MDTQTARRDAREAMTDTLLAHARETLANASPERATLERITAELMSLCERTELWGDEDFPAPSLDEKQNRYRIAQDADTGITLYLNVMRPGKKIRPHDHTVWACIAAVDGEEINTVYARTDAGDVPGKATLEEREVIRLRPGHALTMLPGDIHSVEIGGEDVIRHLHFYGRPLESLTDRTSYDLQAGTCERMDIGVKTKR